MACHVRRVAFRANDELALVRRGADMAGHVPTTTFANRLLEKRGARAEP